MARYRISKCAVTSCLAPLRMARLCGIALVPVLCKSYLPQKYYSILPIAAQFCVLSQSSKRYCHILMQLGKGEPKF